ncbi:MAG: HEAT repeat domain-containing protein [Planctomycetota bacterium]|nr:HEAT repeat domain-containing protein [Planctomycetota bacterium]
MQVFRTAEWARRTAVLVCAAGLPLGAHAQQLVEDNHEREVRLWAEPGMVRNPVSFTMDPWGNVYIAESDRAGQAVTDTRQLEHLNGVEEDLLLRTVEDRRALIQKWIDQGAFEPDHFTSTEDRVRLVRDTDGDGIADTSTIFAGAFNDAVDGIGAGVLWRDGSVYYTCIPNVWKLRDEDGDGVAEQRESISYGYGVRWCFYGHDLHGLVNGPDGRLYFSMGDRGYNVESLEGETFVGPDRGGVFRCWPDGSGLELFAVGLRNPQELAFDEFGNLFTGDNNCDSGDRARVVYCMEGSDSGWRQNVQSLPSRGPWNREKMWELLTDPRDASRPAWCLPPIDHVGAGPSGLAYYPGTGESHAYDDTFLMVDFYGSGSTVHSFRAAPIGAGFRLTEKGEYYRGTTVTDIMWGPDGRLYLSDWGEGWGPNDKGNMFTITNETVHADERGTAEIAEVRALLVEGFADREAEELLALLGHRDQRVRQGAQYALAGLGEVVAPALHQLAGDHDADLVQRVHAVWCVGQIARESPAAAASLGSLLADPEEQIRLAAIRTLGDLRLGANESYRAALTDPSLAVRAAAAVSLGKAGDVAAIPAILDALESNNDNDVYLRHGLTYGLALLEEPDALIDAVQGRGRAARLGAVIALRQMAAPGVVPFMSDADPGVAIEAVRAVYDQYLATGMPALAEKIGSEIPAALLTEPYLRRAIEANVYLGRLDNAEQLAQFAANRTAPAEWRVLALERLRDWDAPLKREGVWGDWVDLPARSTDDARRAVLGSLAAITEAAADNQGLLELAEAVGAKYRLDIDLPSALALLADGSKGESLRIVTLEQLASLEPEALEEACGVVLGAEAVSTTPALRMRARELLAGVDTRAGAGAYAEAVQAGELIERQHAVRQMAALDETTSREHLEALAADLATGTLDAEIALDVFETAREAGGHSLDATEHVVSWEPERPTGFQTPLLAMGGDAARGREVFLHHESAQCARCHTVRGEDAIGTAGPDLTAVGARADRRALVQSLVDPNAVVAEGFGEVSAMPPMSALLSPTQARDVVAYLASLTDSGADAFPVPATVGDLARSGESPAGLTAPQPQTQTKIHKKHLGIMLLPAAAYIAVLVPVILWFLMRLRAESNR